MRSFFRDLAVPGLALLFLPLFLAPVPVRAQTCTGDCGADGAVSINELILAVNIALGRAPFDACPALGSAPVGIAQLIASVNSALCGCIACPTPRPPPSRSSTPSSTATAAAPATSTPTPTQTPVVSYWHEDQLEVASSNCPKNFLTAFRQQIAGAVDDLTVVEHDDTGEVRDTADPGSVIAGPIDADGTLHLVESQTETQGACTVSVDGQFEVNLRHSPSKGMYDEKVHSQHCALNVNCSLHLTSRWTRGLTGTITNFTVTSRPLARPVLGEVQAALRKMGLPGSLPTSATTQPPAGYSGLVGTVPPLNIRP